MFPMEVSWAQNLHIHVCAYADVCNDQIQFRPGSWSWYDCRCSVTPHCPQASCVKNQSRYAYLLRSHWQRHSVTVYRKTSFEFIPNEAKPRGSYHCDRRGCLRGSMHIPWSVDVRFLWTACRKSLGGGVEAYIELCFPKPSGLVHFPERVQFKLTLISQVQSSVTEACNCQHGYQRSYASKG